MPRKKIIDLDNSKIETTMNDVSFKNTTTKKNVKKEVKSESKKSSVTKSTTKKNTTTKSNETTSKTKKEDKSKKTSAKKSSAKSSTVKKSSGKKEKNKEVVSSDNVNVEIIEYYDLPYRYNETIVKVLAQTPNTLFIYWDISDKDRNNFLDKYGSDFFNNTKPILVIHNNTMNYSFEIEIDDFANSWYLHVNDANCNYTVELGRKAKNYNEENFINIPNDYLFLASSNSIDSPNDHVLFDKDLKTVYFMDIKTNIVTEKNITSVSFFRNIGKIYNLYDLQSDFIRHNCIDNNFWHLDLKNPSSGNPSSTFK